MYSLNDGFRVLLPHYQNFQDDVESIVYDIQEYTPIFNYKGLTLVRERGNSEILLTLYFEFKVDRHLLEDKVTHDSEHNNGICYNGDTTVQNYMTHHGLHPEDSATQVEPTTLGCTTGSDNLIRIESTEESKEAVETLLKDTLRQIHHSANRLYVQLRDHASGELTDMLGKREDDEGTGSNLTRMVVELTCDEQGNYVGFRLELQS